MRGGVPIGADRDPLDVLIPQDQTVGRFWPGSRFHADLQVEALPLPRRTAQSSACLNANASDAAAPDPVVQHGFQAY